MIQNQLLTRLATKGKYDKKVFPQIIYGGCALAIYSFVILPISHIFSITLPQFPLDQNAFFWTTWSAVVATGALKRSAIKSYSIDQGGK